MGLATPRGSNTEAKRFSTSLFVVPAESPLKLTARVTSLLFQGSPSNFASLAEHPTVPLRTFVLHLSAQLQPPGSRHSSAIYAVNVQTPLLKNTETAASFNLHPWCTVSVSVMTSSRYKLFIISSTSSGYLGFKLSRYCFRVPPQISLVYD